ncbi:MAG: helix-turn-helix domain-containing protein [Caulobacter sp.]|nr:helix-turn-helix domain-containing protein [Caulobacter sp.]
MTLVLRHHPVPPALRSLATEFIERLDDGCPAPALELPVHHSLIQLMLDADYRVTDPAGVTTTAPRAALWGPSSRTRTGQASGQLHVFVMILTARGARALSGLMLADLVDRTLAMEALPCPSASGHARHIAAAATFERRCELATAWLEDALRSEPAATSACALVDEIAGHRLKGPVERLSRRSGVGPRALHQRFVAQVGWPPKTWLRVARLQRVLRAIHPGAWGDAHDEDVHLEFTDEAHLARDFRDLTGISPSAYRRAKHESGDPLLHTLLRHAP